MPLLSTVFKNAEPLAKLGRAQDRFFNRFPAMQLQMTDVRFRQRWKSTCLLFPSPRFLRLWPYLFQYGPFRPKDISITALFTNGWRLLPITRDGHIWCIHYGRRLNRFAETGTELWFWKICRCRFSWTATPAEVENTHLVPLCLQILRSCVVRWCIT